MRSGSHRTSQRSPSALGLRLMTPLRMLSAKPRQRRSLATQLTRKLICDHVLDPKIRDIPNYEAGEIGFDDLLPGDARFLIDYLMGIKDGQGQPVDTFPK